MHFLGLSRHLPGKSVSGEVTRMILLTARACIILSRLTKSPLVRHLRFFQWLSQHKIMKISDKMRNYNQGGPRPRLLMELKWVMTLGVIQMIKTFCWSDHIQVVKNSVESDWQKRMLLSNFPIKYFFKTSSLYIWHSFQSLILDVL